MVDVSLTLSPIRDRSGQVIGASKILRDVTERKRADEQIAMLAHEAEHRTSSQRFNRLCAHPMLKDRRTSSKS